MRSWLLDYTSCKKRFPLAVEKVRKVWYKNCRSTAKLSWLVWRLQDLGPVERGRFDGPGILCNLGLAVWRDGGNIGTDRALSTLLILSESLLPPHSETPTPAASK